MKLSPSIRSKKSLCDVHLLKQFPPQGFLRLILCGSNCIIIHPSAWSDYRVGDPPSPFSSSYPDPENTGSQKKLKTDNLCCPRIGPGCIKVGEKHNCDLLCDWQLQFVPLNSFQEGPIAAIAAIAVDWTQKNGPQGPILISSDKGPK